MSGVGTPTWTRVPARSRAKNACSITLGLPTASMHTSAPLPPVSARTASTGSPSEASTVWVAPKPRRQLELLGVEVDGDDLWRRPPGPSPPIAAQPTPPHPKTATESPRPTSPVNMAAPRPAITPQPSSPAASGRAPGSTLVHWPAATRVFSAKAPMPSAGDSAVPSARVIFWVALWVEKQYQGRPRRHDRHSPHTARQLRTTKSPGRHRR